MNQHRYQTFLLTRILQGNGYGSIPALLQAIKSAGAIPENEFRARKSAFNAIGDKAPLRNTSDLAITHSDIPAFLAREWGEYNSFVHMTRNATKADQFENALKRFWLTDAQAEDCLSASTAVLSLANQIKAALRNDGFDVGQAADGLWYGADEQDRSAGQAGEYRTEEAAWADLAQARAHILEEAGLDASGVFTEEGPDEVESGTEAPRG